MVENYVENVEKYANCAELGLNRTFYPYKLCVAALKIFTQNGTK